MSRDWGCTSTSYRSPYVLPSYMQPWGLFFDRLLGPLTWYLVSHDGLLLTWFIMSSLPSISADALWDSIYFQTPIATVLGLRYFSHWYDNTGRCGLQRNVYVVTLCEHQVPNLVFFNCYEVHSNSSDPVPSPHWFIPLVESRAKLRQVRHLPRQPKSGIREWTPLHPQKRSLATKTPHHEMGCKRKCLKMPAQSINKK